MIAIYQGSMDPSQPYSDQCLGTEMFSHSHARCTQTSMVTYSGAAAGSSHSGWWRADSFSLLRREVGTYGRNYWNRNVSTCRTVPAICRGVRPLPWLQEMHRVMPDSQPCKIVIYEAHDQRSL